MEIWGGVGELSYGHGISRKQCLLQGVDFNLLEDKRGVYFKI